MHIYNNCNNCNKLNRSHLVVGKLGSGDYFVT